MSKVTFSKIIAGAMSWGIWGKNCTTSQMIELMQTCLEQGITSFDHADIYGDYTTEASFGKALGQSGINRSDIQLISKCGIQMLSADRNTSVKHYEYSRAYILNSVEQSLKNLQTDYLDLILLHRPSPLMQADEIAGAIEKLKADGKILAFGVSNFTPSQTDLIQSRTKVSYNQIECSVTHPKAMTNGSLDHMQINSIVPMAWAPLGSVFKADDARSQRVRSSAAALSEKYGVTVDVLLIAWLLRHPAGILPVCGTANPSRIAGLMQATELEWELQDWFMLLEESMGSPVA